MYLLGAKLLFLLGASLTVAENTTLGCTGPGKDCTKSKCCTDDTKRCYEKNPYWASCRTTCTPGIDPSDPPEYQDPWSCKYIDKNEKPDNSKCAAPGADCTASKCCTQPLQRCYEKNSYWASCKMNCKPGIDPNDPPEYQDPWTCKLLGGGPPPTPPPPPVKPPSDPTPGLTYMSSDLGTAKTTRYWDCCKPSCGWPDKARVSNPVQICDKDAETKLGPNSKNVCGGGGSGGPSYMCAAQQPWYDEKTKMSFGFAAAHVAGVKESGSCCACYELRWESKKLPKMVVQVGNTGADLAGNQFDIQAPGGGFGIFDGCTKQFNLKSKEAWGKRYGGVMAARWSKEKGCKKLPKKLRPGCEWHYDYLGDNPRVSSVYRVVCPKEIVEKSGCKREDDVEEDEGGGSDPERRRGGGKGGSRRRRGKGGKGGKGRRRRRKN